MFLDEVPSEEAHCEMFHLVMVLRNILRAAGVCPILMSTQSGLVATGSVASHENSRNSGEDPFWCRIVVRLPPYVADQDTFVNNPWLIPSERPLVASLMAAFPEKENASKIVDMVKDRLQRQKPNAWRACPALQLCQLFRTTSGHSEDILPECKHQVVGTHFGHVGRISSIRGISSTGSGAYDGNASRCRFCQERGYLDEDFSTGSFISW